MAKKGQKKTWKIGELATETGLTVRTLHYYDQLELLKPSKESEGGHRIYGPEELERLQKILTLKHLGFSLEKIKEALDQPNFSLKIDTSQLRQEIGKRKQELEEIDSRLSYAEKMGEIGDAPVDSIVQLLSRMNLLGRHLSQRQLAWIKDHDIEFGSANLSELKNEWRKATEVVQKAIDENAPVMHWQTKAICMRWFGLACAFMGGSLEWVYDLKEISSKELNAALQLGIPGADLKSIFAFTENVLAQSEKYPAPKTLAYVQVGVSNLKRARAFYDRVLGKLDMSPLFHEPSEVIYGKTSPEFQISSKTHDGEVLAVGNSNCVGFWAGRQQDVDEAHVKIMFWLDDPEKPTG